MVRSAPVDIAVLASTFEISFDPADQFLAAADSTASMLGFIQGAEYRFSVSRPELQGMHPLPIPNGFELPLERWKRAGPIGSWKLRPR